MTHEEEYRINREYEIAVRNLNEKAWRIMTKDEKIHDLQAIENKNAMVQNRLPCEVIAELLGEGEWGYQEGLTIAINENVLNYSEFWENIDTIFHEGSHSRDWQAQFISEVKRQFTPEVIKERNTQVPDPTLDWDGYWNHPTEVAAREAGKDGVTLTQEKREIILAVDKQVQASNTSNQILETYDYVALDEGEDIISEKEKTDDISDEEKEEIGLSEEWGITM